MKRVVVLVNKDFEYAGFIEGLRDTIEVHAGTNGRDAECRFKNLIADIYCIQNLFKEGENSSNSEIKYKYLKELFKSNAFRLDECDGVLSFSTSESTLYSQGMDGIKSRNGCVYVGNKFFLSDQRENDKTTSSHLDIGTEKTNYTERYFEKQICNKLYKYLNETKMSLRPAFNNSANELECFASDLYTCVGVVNVIDYSCYENADKMACEQFINDAPNAFPSGIETTHGVVVKALKETCKELKFNKDIPVNFVSPIVDRYLKFDEDVDGKYGKQNYICSYNGGVATGHILKILNKKMK